MKIKNVRIRSDNLTRHLSRIVEIFFPSCHIAHERIHPATPKEDAHIESFNSILEKEAMRKFEFSSFKDAESTISGFIEFYNSERLHSAIDYRTPREVYEKWKESIIEGSAGVISQSCPELEGQSTIYPSFSFIHFIPKNGS